MADDFNFLEFIEDGTGPAPKDTPIEIQDSDSDADNAEKKDFWDDGTTHGNVTEGSPNSSFNSSPTIPSQNGFTTTDQGHAKQGGRRHIQDRLRNARTYGFRKNVERKVFKGSGAMDHDQSGNYDPNEEAAANRRPAKKKTAVKSELPEVGISQYDSQGEEILPSIEEDASSEESSVDQKRGEGLKKKTKTAAGRKKEKGKEKEPLITKEPCSSCRIFGLECSIVDNPDQFPCTTCSEEGIPCVVKNPKTPEAKNARKLAFAAAKKKKKDQARLQREHKKKEGKKLVQLVAQRPAPTIDPKNRKYIACATCRAGGFHRCSLKTKDDAGPCNRCLSRKVDCTFEDKVIKSVRTGAAKVGKGRRAAGKASSKGKRNLFMRTLTRPREVPKRKGPPNGVFRKIIKTSFCHPINFDVNVDETSFMGMNSFAQTPCHFHTTTAFPMLGLGELNIEVHGPKEPSPANPFVYTECIPRVVIVIQNGEEHEDVEDQTYICRPCTFERQRILFCDTHYIRAIAGLKHPRDYDYDTAYEKILEDQDNDYGANTAGDVKWCSVCIAPAFYECCSPDRYVGEVGCGLLLCEVCAEVLCGGSDKLKGLLNEVSEQVHSPFAPNQTRRAVMQQLALDILIDRARQDIFRYEDGIRADAGFLTSRGELNRWMESLTVGGGEDVYEGGGTRMDEGKGAGAAADLGWSGWGGGIGVEGGHVETFEEYDLRMKLERGKAEQDNLARISAAPSVPADTEDWDF